MSTYSSSDNRKTNCSFLKGCEGGLNIHRWSWWGVETWTYFSFRFLHIRTNYLWSYVLLALFMLFIVVYIMIRIYAFAELPFPVSFSDVVLFYFNHGCCFNLQQEDKEPVFDSTKTIMGMLEVCAEFAQNITFNREKIKKALPAGHLDATTLADYLVKKVSHFPRNLRSIFFVTYQKDIYFNMTRQAALPAMQDDCMILVLILQV